MLAQLLNASGLFHYCCPALLLLKQAQLAASQNFHVLSINRKPECRGKGSLLLLADRLQALTWTALDCKLGHRLSGSAFLKFSGKLHGSRTGAALGGLHVRVCRKLSAAGTFVSS
jgi:hypothetical protein